MISISEIINYKFDPQKCVCAAIILVVVFSVTVYSLVHNRQFQEYLIAEDYYALGSSLVENGRFHPDSSVKYFLRPPIYPLFIAAVLKAHGNPPPLEVQIQASSQEEFNFLLEKTQRDYENIFMYVYMAQAAIHSLTSLLMFILMVRFLNLWVSLGAALLYGLNPYLIILVGTLHYEIVHLFFTIAACCTLTYAFKEDVMNKGLVVLSGILFGIATLTRPMTLIIPFIFAPVVFLKYRGQCLKNIKIISVFCVSMFLIISPYMIRNYMLSHKVIPVTAKKGAVLWALTTPQSMLNANYYNWTKTYMDNGLDVYREVTGKDVYETDAYTRHNLELDQAYMNKSFENIKNNPVIAFNNMAWNFKTFNLDINSVVIKLFQVNQEQDVRYMTREWISPGNKQDFYSSMMTNIFSGLIGCLTILGFVGVILGFKHKEYALLGVLIGYTCFCIAHTISYMDFMYYYIKVPFLYILSAYTMNMFLKQGTALRMIGRLFCIIIIVVQFILFSGVIV